MAYDDLAINSNPTRTPINWSKTITKIPVDNPSTIKHTIAALDSKTLFDGTRSTSIDGTTAFSLALNSQDPTVYRFTNTAGTAPAFRTDRGLTLSGIVLTLTALNNLSLTILAGSGTPFSAVQVGDIVFIPGISTGDGAGPFDELNVGFWTVIAKTSTQLTVTRATNTVFSGISESVTPSSNTQLIAFSAAGVQVGDMVDISSGFSVSNQGTFEILSVTPSWIEVFSTLPLGGETGIIPTASGMKFYSSAKQFLHIDADQNCVIQLNGDTGDYNRLSPFIPGDSNNSAFLTKVGPTWKCIVVNKSATILNITELSAE